jgi:hypothetical protein
MASNGLLNFQGTNKATFVGATSNIALDVVNSSLGIGITGTDPPSSNLYITGNAYVTSDISVGGVLNMGVVNVAARHTLEAITSLGASTPSTLTLTNTGTSLVTSGDVTVDTNTFHVDTTNSRVGVGTVTPQRLLHLKRSGAATFQRIQNVNNNNGCGIELMRGDSDTWGATSWSDWRISNTEHLDFGVKFTGTDITSVLHLHDNGSVGINGITSPYDTLHVEDIRIGNWDGGGNGFRFSMDANAYLRLQYMTGSTVYSNPMTIDYNNNKVAIAQTTNITHTLIVNGSLYYSSGGLAGSDDRIKYNETNINNALTTIDKLKPQKYEKIMKYPSALEGKWIPTDEEWENVKNTKLWDDFSYNDEYGFIAQDVRGIPELSFLVSGDEVDEEGNQTPLGLNYQGIFVVAVKAIQELNTELQAEKEKTRALEDKVEALEDHLTRFTVQVTARLASQK